MIKCCIFDLDGTLLNTLPTIEFYLNKTLREGGYPPISTEQCCAFVGDGARLLVSRALKSVGQEDEGVISRLLDIYKSDYDDSPLYLTEVYCGIRELLCALQQRGILIAVCSNKPDTAVGSICRAFFGDTFVRVRGAMPDVPLKPRPDAPLELLDELGILPSECAFIGDTPVDIHTGRNMGAALSVGVLWGFRTEEQLRVAGAESLISHPMELLDILGD